MAQLSPFRSNVLYLPETSPLDAAFRNVRPVVMRSGQRICTVAIDAEEDFDWDNPVQGASKSTGHIRNLRALVEILAAYGTTPTYLLTYPVLQDPDALTIIRYQLDRGLCAVGLQLHPWVTPPFGESPSLRVSFLGNLAANQQEQKLLTLIDKFVQCFGMRPQVYRAGRYGLSVHTPSLLEKHGFQIDTSIAPRTNFHADDGPDYTLHDNRMFWFGKQRSLLELPLCRDIVGWGGHFAPKLYRRIAERQDSSFLLMALMALMARSRYAERITLSPEGNDFTAMRRLVCGLLAQGQTVFPLSFHSSSLQIGQNPYVRTTADLHHFYDRLSAILDDMASRMAFKFVSMADIPAMLAPPTPSFGTP
jgi:hypothetical protein